MLSNFIANTHPDDAGLLDWIILAGFSLSAGGAVIYRLVAALNGWWTDDK